MRRFEFPALAELLAAKAVTNNLSEQKVSDMFPNMGDTFPTLIAPAR